MFRATNYPSGQVNPHNPNQVTVMFGLQYINRDSNESGGCVPAGFAADGNPTYTGVKTPGACNNKILLSVSSDAGATFTGTTTDPRRELVIPQARAQAQTDQFWQWSAFTRDGRLAVSYYDRQYGGDESNGSSDFTLSGSRDLTDFGLTRVTSSSMPAPTQFLGPKGGQFFGDYTGLAAVDKAHPLWSDTRSQDLFVCPGTATAGSPPALCGATEPTGRRQTTKSCSRRRSTCRPAAISPGGRPGRSDLAGGTRPARPPVVIRGGRPQCPPARGP